MGARPEDYDRVAPHHSYIHVDQFRGPRHLAQYLHMLDKDDDKYNQYFQVRITQASVGSILGNILVERNRRVYQHKILLQSVCLAAPSWGINDIVKQAWAELCQVRLSFQLALLAEFQTSLYKKIELML